MKIQRIIAIINLVAGLILTLFFLTFPDWVFESYEQGDYPALAVPYIAYFSVVFLHLYFSIFKRWIVLFITLLFPLVSLLFIFSPNDGRGLIAPVVFSILISLPYPLVWVINLIFLLTNLRANTGSSIISTRSNIVILLIVLIIAGGFLGLLLVKGYDGRYSLFDKAIRSLSSYDYSTNTQTQPKVATVSATKKLNDEDSLDWETAESASFVVHYPQDWKYEVLQEGPEKELNSIVPSERVVSLVRVSRSGIGEVNLYGTSITSHFTQKYKDVGLVFGGRYINARETVGPSDVDLAEGYSDWTWGLTGYSDSPQANSEAFFVISLEEKNRQPTIEERKVLLKIVSDVKIK